MYTAEAAPFPKGVWRRGRRVPTLDDDHALRRLPLASLGLALVSPVRRLSRYGRGQFTDRVLQLRESLSYIGIAALSVRYAHLLNRAG